MRVLFIGDIVGRPGRRVCAAQVPALRKHYGVDLVVANAENAAGGFGLTGAVAEELLGYGIDCLTTGNHVFAQKDFEQFLAECDRVLRPANYPPGTPGNGYGVFPAGGARVAVLNLNGVVFMAPLDCPFRTADALLDELREQTPIIIVDFHAEATAEKAAFAYFVDGRCSAVIGTHTHVQTADERILAGGTGFITDVGMTGPEDSVIGMKHKIVVERFVTKMPRRFEVAAGPGVINAALLDIDEDTGRCQAIERLRVQ